MSWRVIVGTLSLVITMILLGYVAVTEQDRMANFDTAYTARQIEAGATLFENNCATCHGLNGEGSPRAPTLNTPDLLVNGKRLADAGFAGTVHDFILLTVSAGRPRASATFAQYPQRMPTWSQDYGGPLRDDQIQYIVTYVMNWAPGLANATPGPTQPAVTPVGADITQKLPAGDATAGQAVVQAQGCTACHISQGGAATIGPNWQPASDNNNQGVGTRAPLRIKAADYKGKATSGDQYIFESIVAPDAYIVPGNPAYAPGGTSIMPHDFATKLSAQNVADVIAYLDTIK
jgi:mono/diheme cytochrome c family protein